MMRLRKIRIELEGGKWYTLRIRWKGMQPWVVSAAISEQAIGLDCGLDHAAECRRSPVGCGWHLTQPDGSAHDGGSAQGVTINANPRG